MTHKFLPTSAQDWKQAVKLDNQGTWFLCESHWTVEQLERRFSEELVGTVLYERIGGILKGDTPYIFMQISLMTSTLQQLHPNSEPEWMDVPVDNAWPEDSVIDALKDIRVSVIRKFDVFETVTMRWEATDG